MFSRGEEKNPLLGKPTKWYTNGEKAIIHGREISNGFIYVGKELATSGYDEVDACLIDPSLPAARVGVNSIGEHIGYYPYYSAISEISRGEYLDWLADGCKNTDANISYIFLFFYGLERRLLTDAYRDVISNEEREEIVSEIIRLLSIYGNNNSFNRYANRLLVAEWLIFRKSKEPPEHIDINNNKISEPFKIELGLCVKAEKPLSPDVALRWFVMHPDYKLKTPARRCADEFNELFRYEYKREFDDGLYIYKGKGKLKFTFIPSSPSVEKIVVKVDLPDCFNLSRPLSQINKVVNRCTDQLEEYSRYKRNIKNKEYKLKKMSLLPSIILNKNSKAISAREELQRQCESKLWFPTLSEVYQTIDEKSPQVPDKDDLKYLFSFLQSLGFGVAPDIRYQNIKLGLNSSVTIFPLKEGIYLEPSKEFNALSSIIRLGAIMSRIDGHIHEDEVKIITNLLDNDIAITPLERQYLESFLYWCFHADQEDALSITGLKPYIKPLSKSQRKHIAELLILIMYADKAIKREEVKKLEKFYPILGLRPVDIPNDVFRLYARVMGVDSESHTAAKQPVADADFRKGYSIPSLPDTTSTGRMKLNQDKIDELLKETKVSKKVLVEIFQDKEQPKGKDIIDNSDKRDDPLLELDDSHRQLLNHLAKQNSWERQELINLCENLRLMFDGAIETINEWAVLHSKVPLIISDAEDIIYVDTDIMSEVTNEQS